MGIQVKFKMASTINADKNKRFKCPDNGYYDGHNDDQFYPSFTPGQIIFVEDIGKLYVDFHAYRKCYSGSGGVAPSNSLNYVGISTEDPTKKVTIAGKADYEPSLNDIVVYQSKEFIYRYGLKDTEPHWYELGDEDSLNWEDNA